MRDRKQVYLEIWSRIENLYFNGYMANERTLHAELYRELRNTLPDVHVVAEPAWTVGGDTKYPDLVIVEKGQITDIFELKIWNNCLEGKVMKDIRKLLRYGADETCRVGVDPNTGQCAEELPVSDSCRLHFVVVANFVQMSGNNSLLPTDLRRAVRALKEETPALQENPRVLNHWFGRVGGNTAKNREWSIEFGIR